MLHDGQVRRTGYDSHTRLGKMSFTFILAKEVRARLVEDEQQRQARLVQDADRLGK